MDRVFRGVRQLGEFTVSDLTDIVCISRTTVRKEINALLACGIVESLRKGESTDEGGKPPNIYFFRTDAKFVLAMHIGSKTLFGRIVNLSGDALVERSKPMIFNMSIENLLNNIESISKSLIEEAGINYEDILGLAFGTHGITDFKRGIVVSSPHNPSWGSYMQLRELIETRLNYPFPVFVDNTVRFRTLAEVSQGSLSKLINSVVVHTSEGVIAGIIQNDYLYRGPNNLAGSIGHLIVNPGDDLKCTCGGNGCFEMQVQPGRVLENCAIAVHTNGDSEEQLAEILATLPDQPTHVRQSIMEVATWFAILFHNMIVMWDPDVIILQGVYARAHDSFLKAVNEHMSTVSLLGVRIKTKVIVSELGENAPGIGAVSYVISHTI